MSKLNTYHHEIPAASFSIKVRRELMKKGIAIVGMTTLPGRDPFTGAASFLYNTQTGYCLNDNDTGRIATYADVMALGGEPIKWA